MSKYNPLGKELARRNTERIKMTFAEIEGILGFSLPKSLREYSQAWHGRAEAAETHAWKKVWHYYGYGVESVNRKAEEVIFIKHGVERLKKWQTPKVSRFDATQLLVVDMGAGSYDREQGGHERFNLDRNRTDGRYYGYCPHDDVIDICKNFGATSRDEFVDGILVVYVSKKENSNDRETIAYCPSARVYGKPQPGDGLNRKFPNKKTKKIMTSTYSIVSEELIEIGKGRMTIINDDKTTLIPGNTDPVTSNRFRAQRFYGKKYPQLAKKIVDYIDSLMDGVEMLDDDFDDQEGIQQADPLPQSERKGTADRALETVLGVKGESVKKSEKISKTALEEAQYKCEMDPSHTTFTSTRGMPYMEGHHLIPCTLTNAQDFMDEYEKNIDCVENIVCLCPTCHRAVHFGDKPTRQKYVRAMYTSERAEKLKNAGIPITEDELLGFYKKRDNGDD